MRKGARYRERFELYRSSVPAFPLLPLSRGKRVD